MPLPPRKHSLALYLAVMFEPEPEEVEILTEMLLLLPIKMVIHQWTAVKVTRLVRSSPRAERNDSRCKKSERVLEGLKC